MSFRLELRWSKFEAEREGNKRQTDRKIERPVISHFSELRCRVATVQELRGKVPFLQAAVERC